MEIEKHHSFLLLPYTKFGVVPVSKTDKLDKLRQLNQVFRNPQIRPLRS